MKLSLTSIWQHSHAPPPTATRVFGLVLLMYLAFCFMSLDQPEQVAAATKASINSAQLRTQAGCSCGNSNTGKRKPNDIPHDQPESHCSAEATLLGPGQNVISYTLFTRHFWTFKTDKYQEKKREWYISGFHCNIRDMRKLYPAWVMRIYTNLEPSELCDFACEPDVFICDVRNLPTRFGNLLKVNPTIWRFLVLGDPTVFRFIVRDLDARLLPRERAAVDEWVASKKPFHAMRDHTAHTAAILGGCWGGNNNLIGYDLANRMLFNISQQARKETNLDRGGDQRVLQNVLYDNWRDKFLIHDSYHCNEFKDSVPFPTQRANGKDPVDLVVGVSGYCLLEENQLNLAGNQFSLGQQQQRKRVKTLHKYRPSFISPCPYECRPSYGKNWTYC